jgi:hypothetical protein
MSRSSRARANSRRSRRTSSSLAFILPWPGKASSPSSSSCLRHLYSVLGWMPRSLARSMIGLSLSSESWTASILNSRVYFLRLISRLLRLDYHLICVSMKSGSDHAWLISGVWRPTPMAGSDAGNACAAIDGDRAGYHRYPRMARPAILYGCRRHRLLLKGRVLACARLLRRNARQAPSHTATPA